MRWSIRWRLTLWNTLVLTGLLVGFGLVVYLLLYRTLYDRLDNHLLTELHELTEDTHMGKDPADRIRYLIAEFKEHENYSCIVYDDQGRTFQRTKELAEESVPAAPAIAGSEPQWDTVDLPIVRRQRRLTAAIRLADQPFNVILLAPLEDVDLAMNQLLTVLGMVGSAVPLVGGVVGYLLARKALAPVKQLERATKEITADRLDRRLTVNNANDELGQLTQTFNDMIGRLQRSFAEIRRFTADASHELRTPLTALRTEVEVAMRRSLTADETQALFGSILEECERLTRLTDQLLSLSREDGGLGREHRTTLDLSGLVSTVVETMRPLAQVKGVRLQFTPGGPLFIQGDGERLRQVFYNVLDNAIKYTAAGGDVTVLIERRDQAAVVTVQDTGIGIPLEHLPHIFERFYRVDKARSRAEGGTGLGLSIALSIVNAHGGTIELHSSPANGTTCEVVLPLSA
jgi:two-component system, OmpR family, heavy metal sensor histidine kinase CusS